MASILRSIHWIRSILSNQKKLLTCYSYLIDQYGYTKADLGKVSLALSLAYGSVIYYGNVSDRSNPKYFITIGLVASAAVSLIFGLVPAVLSSLTFMIVLSALNGWFQGDGDILLEQKL